ncbi:MAG: (2Fe-2S)-binding protein [Xanthobacteraceae bacterium]|nr:(2Fe-2S)-binding protein [Xanthobacteraceae bacterium]
MEEETTVRVTVNGAAVTRRVPVRRNLADFLRRDLGLTGTHVGCEHGVCGACTVRLDGEIVRSCLLLAAQADGSSVDTIEGLSESGEIAALQDAFLKRNALQCGFCTPGMLVTAADLLRSRRKPTREEIRDAISANYCRCTGYQAIVDAVAAAAQTQAPKP